MLSLSNSETFNRSRQAGEWKETFWSQHDSEFQTFADNSRVSLSRLNEDFTEPAPITVVLGPLTTFTEYKRTAVWRRVLKGALSTVFGDTVDVNFSRVDTTDYSQLLR